uniref:Uncharacterized protein n=1 Tax=viral metagenome TaxID=1070528 RepID=A0A6M3L841_9ZZZZ
MGKFYSTFFEREVRDATVDEQIKIEQLVASCPTVVFARLNNELQKHGYHITVGVLKLKGGSDGEEGGTKG